MGRKPNPIIAAHFIRGNKHGQTTNRYAQTCSHCGLHFPTGRPETLLTHLVSCPMLNANERAGIIHRMYNTAPAVDTVMDNLISYQQQSGTQSVTHNHDFDITGLNVLAGAAENAEDLVIDPQITERESTPQTTTAGGPPLPFYDHQYGNSYHNPTSNNPWSFQFTTSNGPPSPSYDLPDDANPDTPFTTADLPVTHWSFAPVITAPTPYTTHMDHSAPISFADQHDNTPMHPGDGSSGFLAETSTKSRARKSREPYNEPKRARVAEMRQIGACIRCSRLRKNCDPQRPCELCKRTAAKTWIGGCTSLTKGQEFTVWFDSHLSKLYRNELQARVKDTQFEDVTNIAGDLQLRFFGQDGPCVSFEVDRRHPVNTEQMDGPGQNTDIPDDSSEIWVISEQEDIVQKIRQHALEHQEVLLDAIENPAIFATVRIAQGLSSQSNGETGQVWGTSKQGDNRLESIFELWLVVTLITNDKFTRTWSVSNSEDFVNVDDRSVQINSQGLLSTQADIMLDEYLQSHQEELRKFDANILNQNYKHLFNLVVGMFLILDAVEQYCCYLTRRKCSSVDNTAMIEQARALAHKYTYCVHNIQMMPKISANEEGLLVADDKSGKIDHEMQRLWIIDLCMSETDMIGYLNEQTCDEWLISTGRLWVKLFIGLRLEV